MTYDRFDLSGKVAVITGGNGGIGLGFARAIAAAGAHVSIWGTNPKKNAAAIQELQAINPSASVLLCDVSDENAVEDSMAKVIDRYGRIDACFPNAGIGSQNQKPFLSTLAKTGSKSLMSTCTASSSHFGQQRDKW